MSENQQVSSMRSLMRNNWITDNLYLFIALFIFYSLWLGHYPVFTPDEGRYSEIAREMIFTKDYITPRVNGIAFLDKPILYYWLQALAIQMFGLTEWALRFFPMLLGILGCIATYGCGRILFNRRTGLIAVSILATSPLYFGSAHYADMNLEVAVFITCSLLFFITALHINSVWRSYLLFAAYVCSALAFLTKGLIGIAFPTLIIFIWMSVLRKWSMLKKIHLIKGLIVFLILTIPWYIQVHQANPSFLHYFFITQQVTRFVSGAVFNNPSPFWFYIPIVIIGLFPWIIFLIEALRHHVRLIWRTTLQRQTELYLLLWVMIIFFFFSIPHSKTIGYILPIFPPLALLIASYLDGIWDVALLQNKKILLLFIFLSCVLGFILFALPIYHWLDFAAKLDLYLRIMASILLASCILALFSIRKSSLTTFFLICLISNMSILLLLTHSAKYLNLNSAKPLVTELKRILKPQDEVIAYFKYYQDVPLYLGQQIKVVANWNAPDIAQKDNWAREFWFGIPFQNTNHWLINEENFWQEWQSQKRVFVFLNKNYFAQFQESAQNYFYLGSYNDIILLSNQPTYLLTAL